MRSIALLSGLALCITSCISPSQAKPDIRTASERIAASSRALENLAANGFNGSAIVACGADILLNRDYGNPDEAGKTTRYEVASISKLLTAIAVLKLVEDKQLALSDQLAKHFSDVPESHAAITVFQLVTHQSGIRQTYAAEGHDDRGAAARAIFATRLRHPPGEAFHYSNDNFSLLAMIIEKVSGETYGSYLNRVISQPLGLEPLRSWPDPQQVSDEYLPPLLQPPRSPRGKQDWGFLGGHGARLSVDEIFAIMSGLEEGSLLSKASVSLLRTAHVRSSGGVGIGMGWYTRTDEKGRTLAYTSGSDQSGGNAIAYRVDDKGLLIIAATNNGPPEKDGPGWSRQVRDILISGLAKSESHGDICTETDPVRSPNLP